MVEMGFNPVLVGLFIYQAIEALMTGSKSALVPLTVLAMEAFSVAFGVVMALITALMNFIRARYFDLKPQFGGEEEGNLLTAVIDTFTSLFHVKNRSELVRLADDVSKISRGADTSRNFVGALTSYMPTWLTSYAASLLPRDIAWAYAASHLDPEGFIANVHALTDQHFALSYTDAKVARQIGSLWETRCELAKILIQYPPTREFAVQFNAAAKKLDNWHTRHFIRDPKNRPIPFNLTIFGASGIGKTVAITNLCKHLGATAWAFKPGFWDGYAGQDAVVYDDWGATDYDAEDIQKWLTIHSNAPLTPEFASLSDPAVGVKGTLFSSHYIFCTTNVPYALPNAVRDREAYLRRRNLLVEMKCDDRCTPPLRTFTVHNSVTPGNPISQPMEWDAFLEYFKKCATDHFVKERQMVTSNSAIQASGDPFRVVFDPLTPQMNAEEVVSIPLLTLPPTPTYPDNGNHIAFNLPTPPIDIPVPGIMATVKSNYDYYYQRAVNLLKAHPYITGAIIFAGAAYITHRYLTSGTLDAQAAYEAGELVRSRNQRAIIPRVVKKPLETQMDVDTTNLGVIRRALVDITFTWLSNDGTPKGHTGTGHGIGTSHMLIVPTHYLVPLLTKTTTSMHMSVTRYFIKGEPYTFHLDVHTGPNTNINLLYTGSTLHDLASIDIGSATAFHNIENYFTDDIYDTSACTLLAHKEGDDLSLHAKYDDTAHPYIAGPSYNGLTVNMLGAYTYKASTVKGDCGRPLIQFDQRNQYRIIGMHTTRRNSEAKNTDAYSMPIHRIDVKQLAVGITLPSMNLPEETQMNDAEFLTGEFTQISSKMPMLHAPLKHNARPSVIAKYLGPPARINSVLTIGDVRTNDPTLHPMHRCLANKSHPAHNYDQTTLDHALHILINLFPECPRKHRILSLHESIYGIPGYVRSLNFASSAGYPWVRYGTKRSLFFDDQGSPRIFESLIQACEFRESEALKGHRVPTIWTEFLKDELRLVGKVENSITRAICGAPVDFSIVFRQYFQSLIQWIEDHRHGSLSIVGIDINSREFHDMITEVMRFPNIIATDYRNNDGSFPVQLIEGVCKFFNYFYSDGFDLLRRTLCDDACYTYHYWRNYLFLDNGSLNSGFAGTTMVNTLGNALEDLYVMILLAPQGLVIDANYIRSNFVIKRYGDDNIQSFSVDAAQWYSIEKHIAQVNKNGREMTSEDKLSAASLKRIDEVRILKQCPVLDTDDFNGYYTPRFDKVLIEDIARWTQRGGDNYQQTAVVCEAALRFAFWHGRDYYNTLRDRYLDAFEKLEEHVCSQPMLPTYEQTLLLTRIKFFDIDATPTTQSLLDAAMIDIGAYLKDPLIASFPDEHGFLADAGTVWLIRSAVYNTSFARVVEQNPNIFTYNNPQILLFSHKVGLLPPGFFAYPLSTSCLTAVFDLRNGEIETYIPIPEANCTRYYRIERYLTVEDDQAPSSSDKPGCYDTLNQHQAQFYVRTHQRVSVPVDLMSDTTYSIEYDLEAQATTMDIPDELINTSPPEVNANSHFPSPDDRWDMRKLLARRFQFTNVNWAVDSLAAIMNINIPWDLLVSAQQRSNVYAFQHFRATIHIQIDVNGTRFHQGMLGVGFSYDSNLRFQLPHAIIDANQSKSAHLEMPFVWPKTFLRTNPPDTYMRFVAVPILPLRASTGSTQFVPISAYAWFTNVEYEMPALTLLPGLIATEHAQCAIEDLVNPLEPQGNSSSHYVTTTNYGSGNISSKTDDQVDLTTDVSPKLAVSAGQAAGDASTSDAVPTKLPSTGPAAPPHVRVTQGDHPNRIVQKRDNFDRFMDLANFGERLYSRHGGGSRQQEETTGPNLRATSSGQSYICSNGNPTEILPGGGGLDLVGNFLDPPLVMSSTLGHYYNVSNIEPVYHMKMYPDQLTKTAVSDTAHTTDEMLIEYLVRFPHRIDTFIFGSQSAGSLLNSYYVEPTFFDEINIHNVRASVPWTQALATLANYWAGDMIFTFLIASSGYQTGKLLFSVAYGEVQPTTIIEAQNAYTRTHDLSDPERIVSIRVPYMSLDEMTAVSRGPLDPRTTKIATLYIYVMSPLTAPTGSPASVDIAVFVAGAPNLQFVGVAPAASYSYSAQPPTLRQRKNVPGSKYEMKTSDEDFVCLEAQMAFSCYDLVNKSKAITPKDTTDNIVEICGDRHYSLRDFFKARFPTYAAMLLTTTGPYVLPWASAQGGHAAYTILDNFFLRRGGFRVTFHCASVTSNDRVCIIITRDMVTTTPPSSALAWYRGCADNMFSNYVSPASTDFRPFSNRAFTALLEPNSTTVTIEVPHLQLNRSVTSGTPAYNIILVRESKNAEETSPLGVTIFTGLADETRHFHLFRDPDMQVVPYTTYNSDICYPTQWGNPPATK